jgi:hypothetical protein
MVFERVYNFCLAKAHCVPDTPVGLECRTLGVLHQVLAARTGQPQAVALLLGLGQDVQLFGGGQEGAVPDVFGFHAGLGVESV